MDCEVVERLVGNPNEEHHEKYYAAYLSNHLVTWFYVHVDRFAQACRR